MRSPRLPLAWVALGLALAALICGGCLNEGSGNAHPLPTNSKLWGAATPKGYKDLTSLDAFERDAGKKVSLFMFFESWAQFPDFNASHADAVRGRGALPILSWEPWDWTSGTDQPKYRLSAIARGAYDPFLRRWAREIAAWGKPILIRFAHEMNGDWYPWSAAANGNSARGYIAAWRHVHRIFDRQGASNVRWLWAPNRVYKGAVPLRRLYPGDRYVDWMGVDAYNRASVAPLDRPKSFRRLVQPTLRALQRLGRKPILLTETAAAEEQPGKAAWIRDFFKQVSRMRDLRGFVWFNFKKGSDWRIESSSAAQQAFADGIKNPVFKPGH